MECESLDRNSIESLGWLLVVKGNHFAGSVDNYSKQIGFIRTTIAQRINLFWSRRRNFVNQKEKGAVPGIYPCDRVVRCPAEDRVGVNHPSQVRNPPLAHLPALLLLLIFFLINLVHFLLFSMFFYIKQKRGGLQSSLPFHLSKYN